MANSPYLKFRSLGHAAALACSLEAAAPKVGNVHRGADFDNLTFYDFLLSAQLLGDSIDQHASGSLGELILAIVSATRAQVQTNSNLGIALLLAPLVKSFREGALSSCTVLDVLEASTARDCALIYEAIRLAHPGGLGSATQHDVHASTSPDQILIAMESAKDRDLIARQYCTGLADVFDLAVPSLLQDSKQFNSLIRGIISTHLRLLAVLGDSLVVRKCGPDTGRQLQARAADIVNLLDTRGWEAAEPALADFDFWLRSDSNRRNPGATADMIAAALFVAILQGQLHWPRS